MAVVERLVDNLSFGEGPRWHDGRLWFSDFFDHAVKSVDLAGDVRVEVQFETPRRPSGLGWMPDGSLLVVSMIDRSVLRVDGDVVSTHADLSSIATFHCNDMVVDPRGRAYVGNFGFDLDEAFATRGAADTFAHHDTAAMARVEPDGTVHLAADDLEFPNGAVITPDGRTLIVGETLGAKLTAFDIADDGSLGNRRVWAALPPRTAPDGICLDADLHVWVANPAGNECVLVAEGGAIIDRISTDRPCYACMLGGDDRRTLFMLTAMTSVHTENAERTGAIAVATVAVPGAGRP